MNQSSAEMSPRNDYLEYHLHPNNCGTNFQIKIILNECHDMPNSYENFHKIEDTECTKFISIPNGNIRISNYKMAKNKVPTDELTSSSKTNLNRNIYLPEPEPDIVKSESNNQVLFRKSFKPISNPPVKYDMNEMYENFLDDDEDLTDSVSQKSQSEDTISKVSSESAVINLDEEQKNFVIKQLSEIAKSRAESHTTSNKILHYLRAKASYTLEACLNIEY
ncbi:hypothetical protein BpHYR1_041774 [Brachionus plicatilis]|uniref:Uncharacterized protein n=1 Tax=Brachionus plicatilis TaxID=10195 RepID=A0A3M7PPE3_BRAPC|nr:hypothetical protein BpHYR1_041774 [Brachionus plicatilis]